MRAVGLLPCGGLGLRMRPFRYPKELLPVTYLSSPDDGHIYPKLLINSAIDSFCFAGIRHSYIVIPDWKPEIMRYLQDGGEFEINIAYLHNSKAIGLAEAVFSSLPWLKDEITCLALPDTQFVPSTAFVSLLNIYRKKKPDLVLGVFPTDKPQLFAPVELDKYNRVVSVEDKPSNPKFLNTWGIAVWGSSFWQFLSSEPAISFDALSISYYFDKAVKQGLNVLGLYFENGQYYDFGQADALPLVKVGIKSFQ